MPVYILCSGRLSFALIAGKMKEKVRVVAMDMRGHGLTKTSNDTDLSAEAWCITPFNLFRQFCSLA